MFIPASNRRVDGWNLMQQYLHYDTTKEPKLRYFNTCFDSIRTIPTLIHDDIKPEDLDTDGEDHAADPDRYFLMSLHERASSRPKSPTEQKLEEMKQQLSVSPSNFNQIYYPNG